MGRPYVPNGSARPHISDEMGRPMALHIDLGATGPGPRPGPGRPIPILSSAPWFPRPLRHGWQGLPHLDPKKWMAGTAEEHCPQPHQPTSPLARCAAPADLLTSSTKASAPHLKRQWRRASTNLPIASNGGVVASVDAVRAGEPCSFQYVSCCAGTRSCSPVVHRCSSRGEQFVGAQFCMQFVVL